MNTGSSIKSVDNTITLLSSSGSIDSTNPNKATQEQINNLNAEIKKFRFLMNLLIFNSGFMLLLELPNLFYIKQKLKEGAANYTQWHTFRSAPWVIKALFGCFSDVIFPFRLK